MSTNSKDVTATQSSEILIAKGKRTVDRSVRALMAEMEHENTLLADTTGGRLQHLLKIYRGVKPLLAILNALPLIPSNWRAAMVLFTQAVEALANAASRENAGFKAGKDL